LIALLKPVLFVVDWSLYAQVLDASIRLLNEMAHNVLILVEAEADSDPLPYLDTNNITDTQ